MYLAVDIGGTKISAGYFDGKTIRNIKVIPTCAWEGQDSVLRRFLAFLGELSSAEKIQGIGIACPGPLSSQSGVVIHAPCLGWKNVPIIRLVQSITHCPVILENDANAAAIGEYLFGAGKGSRSIAYITVSTGVGCGIVLNGQIWEGSHEGAGELGHLPLYPGGKPCPCGKKGCLERYASGTAIAEKANEVLQKSCPGTDPVSTEKAAELARCGNKEMQRVFREAGKNLGLGIASLLQLMDIERIVLGGSVTKAFDLWETSLRHSVSAHCYWGKKEEPWLYLAELDGNAGLYGAGHLIQKDQESSDSVSKADNQEEDL